VPVQKGVKHYYYHCNHCSEIRFRADGAHERLLSIIAEINFSKNENELYDLMVKKIFQDRKPKRKNSEESVTQEIAIYQKRIINLQDDYADRKISLEDYKVTIDRYRQKIQTLQLETIENQSTQTDYKKFLKSGINLLTNFKRYYVSTDLTSRMRPFEFDISRKTDFGRNKSRTTKINEALRLLLATDKGFNENGTTQIFKNLELSPQVELRGVEPLSKHIRQKLSTCLFHYCLSAMNRE